MLETVERVRKEWAVIKGAPYSCLIVALIMLGAIWGVFAFSYHMSLENAQQETHHWQSEAERWQSDAGYWKDFAQRPVTGVTPNSVEVVPLTTSVTPPATKNPAVPPKHEAQLLPGIPKGAGIFDPNSGTRSQTCNTGPCVNGDNRKATVTNNYGPVPRVLNPCKLPCLPRTLDLDPSASAVSIA